MHELSMQKRDWTTLLALIFFAALTLRF